jgi:hypothetical protein
MDPTVSFLLDNKNVDPEPDIGYVPKLTILVEGILTFFFKLDSSFSLEPRRLTLKFRCLLLGREPLAGALDLTLQPWRSPWSHKFSLWNSGGSLWRHEAHFRAAEAHPGDMWLTLELRRLTLETCGSL